MTDPRRSFVVCSASAIVCCLVASATSPAQAQQPAPPAAQAPSIQAPAPQPQPQFQPSGDWEKLPKMQLERQFAGPLRDTVIQRLRDPVDGTICYLYLPISAPHSQIQGSGFVQYGGNTIGSINCLPAPAQARPTASRKQ